MSAKNNDHRRRAGAQALALALFSATAAVTGLSACGGGESGIAPPLDRLFFPAGVVQDPDGPWLYVVNSNSDLRYNAGTVVAVNADRAAEDRTRDWGDCPTPQFLPGRNSPPRFCCRDFFDRGVLNCDERAYVASQATVRIGSFGGAAALQSFQRAGQSVHRLFVAVRGDPSVTTIDVTTEGPAGVAMRCTGPRGDTGPVPPGNPVCDGDWLIRTGTQDGRAIALPEEPFSLAMDEPRGVLYVGHLSLGMAPLAGGVSSIDICHPERPTSARLAAVTQPVFTFGEQQAVTSVTVHPRPDGAPRVFASSRLYPELAELTPRSDGGRPCGDGTAPRDLQLVNRPPVPATAFSVREAELRTFLTDPEGTFGYLLHRNLAQRPAPAAISVLDLRDTDLRAPRPVGYVEVCSGPTEMQWHDAGKGARLYVVCFESGQLYVVNPQPLTVESVINVGRGPNALAFDHRDPTVAYVTAFADNDMAVVDLRPGSRTENRVVQRIGFPRTQVTGRRRSQ